MSGLCHRPDDLYPYSHHISCKGRRKHLCLILFAGLGALENSLAQDSSTAPASPPPPPVSSAVLAPSDQAAHASTTAESPPFESLGELDELFSKGDSQRRAFEVYLEAPAISPDDTGSYVGQFNLILSLLKDKNLDAARAALALLSKNDWLDVGLSKQLGEKLDALQQVQVIKGKIEAKNTDLQSSLAQPSRTPEEIADSLQKQSMEAQKAKATGGSETPDPTPDEQVLAPPPGMQESTALTQEYLDTLKTKAQITANEQDKNLLLQQSQSDFALYITQFYQSGHYRHVILAAAFYQVLYDLPDIPSDLKHYRDSSVDIEKRVSILTAEVTTSVEHGKLGSATLQLWRAYLLDPGAPEILQIDPSSRKSIREFERRLSPLRDALQARALGKALLLLQQLAGLSPDFEAAPILQRVQAVIDKSGQLLEEGRQKVHRGDTDGAFKDFQEAQKLWPSNPALGTGAAQMAEREEKKVSGTKEFDQLFQLQQFDAISQRQAEFADLFKDDSIHTRQLAACLNTIQLTDSAIAKAQAMKSSGDAKGAWETVNSALTGWPANQQLIQLKRELGLDSALFVIALDNAQSAEKKHELGLSLSWYAIAHQNYPPSAMAKEGITRVSTEIFSTMKRHD